MSTALDSGIIWRFQSGPMLHLGLSSSGTICWQKSTITGVGRLKPIHLHVAVEIASGRIQAELESTGEGDLSGFLSRALKNADSIGGAPRTIVFARDVARAHPKLLDLASEAGATPAFGTQAFKLRQKISSHFEDFLHSQIVRHDSLSRMENLAACLPRLVGA